MALALLFALLCQDPPDLDSLFERMTSLDPEARTAAQAEFQKIPRETLKDSPLALAFAPLHKQALGIAVGLAAGLVMAAVTIIVRVRGAATEINLNLLAAYFYGYSVSWRGVLVGFGWAFLMGFTIGWFVAFCRNLVLAISLFLVRTRAELVQTRDFLDHI